MRHHGHVVDRIAIYIRATQDRERSEVWREVLADPRDVGIWGDPGLHGLGDRDPEIRKLRVFTKSEKKALTQCCQIDQIV